MKLRARFTALFAILAAATVAVLVLVSDAVVGRAVSERVAERFGRELEHLAEDLARGDVPETGRDDFLRAAAKQLECRVTYIAPGGRVLDDTDLLPADVPSMENHAGREEVRQAVEGGTGRSRRISPTEQRPMLYVARKLPDGSVLRLAVSEARLRQVELAYLWAMRLAIAAACLVLFLIGSAASRRFSEPIAELTRSAAAIAAGDFARDLPRAGGEEVQLLSGAVQRMKDSLNAALERAEGERRLAAMVFETLPDGLVVVDAKLKVLESQRAFRRDDGRADAGRPRRLRAPAREAPLRLLRNDRADGGDDRADRAAGRRPRLADHRRAASAGPPGGGGRRAARRLAPREDRGDAADLRRRRLARAADADRLDRGRGRDARRRRAGPGRDGGAAGPHPPPVGPHARADRRPDGSGADRERRRSPRAGGDPAAGAARRRSPRTSSPRRGRVRSRCGWSATLRWRPWATAGGSGSSRAT